MPTKVSKRKQSVTDQTKRFDRGCCPVHNYAFQQEASWGVDTQVVQFGSCPRTDCGLMAVLDGPSEVRQLITPEQKEKIQSLWRDLYRQFVADAKKRIDAELDRMSRSPEVQLPVSVD